MVSYFRSIFVFNLSINKFIYLEYIKCPLDIYIVLLTYMNYHVDDMYFTINYRSIGHEMRKIEILSSCTCAFHLTTDNITEPRKNFKDWHAMKNIFDFFLITG